MSSTIGRPRLALVAGQHWCSGCMEYKPVAEFAHDASRHDGLYHYCRACRRYYYRRAQRRVQQRRTEAAG